MIRGYRPLLISRLDAAAGGVRLLRLEVHRHLADHKEVGTHRHAHAQALLYLTGRGEQELAGERHPVAQGTLVLAPAGVRHAFHRTTPRAPLCLVLDFSDKRAQTTVARLPAVMLREIRNSLHHIAALHHSGGADVEAAGWALVLLGKLRAAAGSSARPQRAGGIRALLERRLSEAGAWAHPVAVLARRCGYQQDYLNRKVKEETGLTLNQFRARVRLERARTILSSGGRSAAAAEAAGFDDVNYFTRWFKLQTGVPPGAWKRKAGEASVNTVRDGSHRSSDGSVVAAQKRRDDRTLRASRNVPASRLRNISARENPADPRLF